MTTEIPDKWCYSLNEENFDGTYDTEEEAHEEAKSELNNNHEPGGQHAYWVAKTVHPIDKINTAWGIETLGDFILEHLDERASGEIAADDDIFAMNNDDIKALGAMVMAFVKEKATARFFGVDGSQEFTHTTE